LTDGPADHDGGKLAGLVAAIELVGPRWALLVVGSLLDGPKRCGDLQRELGYFSEPAFGLEPKTSSLQVKCSTS
jgi:DNA-binding HxlR family transcriptional regulator